MYNFTYHVTSGCATKKGYRPYQYIVNKTNNSLVFGPPVFKAESGDVVKNNVIVIPWIVRLYVEIIHELERADYLTYRWTNTI